jgi:diguanylate cyclase (GGDEF)-like protein
MQAATTRRRKKPPLAAVVPDGASQASRRAPVLEEIIDTLRQDYLDALPIAAAIISAPQSGAASVDAANAHFRRIGGSDEEICGARIDRVPFLAAGPIGRALGDFLNGESAAHEFEGHDGQTIGGRHFTVRLARLAPRLGVAKRCLISMIDKTAQVETEKSLRAEMLRDTLTGLPNRLAFNERVEEILEHPNFHEGTHAVVVVDMTRFSRVNECMGALAGDELLITFARRLFSTLRAGDVLARTGGDEFGILMRLERGIDDALELAERIKSVLATPFRLSEMEIRVDCSVGCALLTQCVELSEEVLRNAQFALKRSKQTGRAQIYEPTQAQAARHRFSIETELRRAIEANQLTLAFQPLIDLPTGTVSGFEALARWDHEERGQISPVEFIPVAEESGLIVSLGRWALNAAAQTLADWDKQVGRKLPLYVAVNLSAIQIARDDMSEAVGDALKSSGLEGRRLTLELTESAIVQDPLRATKVLEALKAFDARVAMDDFGTGYTSLSYLQRLPIDMLKIDRSFVTGMLADRDSVAIIRAVLSLADALGMATTAEGVESEELAKALTELGCSHGQGFFFAKPLAAQAALAYWLSRNA